MQGNFINQTFGSVFVSDKWSWPSVMLTVASRALALLVDGDDGCSKSVSLTIMSGDGIYRAYLSDNLLP